MKKFFIIATASVVSAAIGFFSGTVFGYKNADKIDERVKAAEEKTKKGALESAQEAVAEKVEEIKDDATEIADEVCDKINKLQPRTKDGKFAKRA